MGVELNFLAKEKKAWRAWHVIVVAVLLLSSIGAGTLWLQVNHLTPIAAAAKVQQSVGGAKNVDELQVTHAALSSIKEGSVQHGGLYNQVMGALGLEATLNTFDYAGGATLELNAGFASLDDTSLFSDRLQELPQIKAVRTGEVIKTERGDYSAAFSIDVDVEALQGSVKP